ncbi:unnamed protein product [Urochloa humidicola]
MESRKRSAAGGAAALVAIAVVLLMAATPMTTARSMPDDTTRVLALNTIARELSLGKTELCGETCLFIPRCSGGCKCQFGYCLRGVTGY